MDISSDLAARAGAIAWSSILGICERAGTERAADVRIGRR